MKYTISPLNSFVSLFLLGGLSLGEVMAQQPQKTSRADTLRRELTVVSDAEVHLDAATPMASTYLFDKPKVTRLRPVPPRSTGDFTPSVVLPEHPALSDMASWVPRSERPAYVDLSIDPFPRVHVQAGYSDIWQKKHLFDAHVGYDGSWGNIAMFTPSSLQNTFYRHHANGQLLYEYLGEGATHTLFVRGDYDRFNYYGHLYGIPQDHQSPLDARQNYEAISYRYTTSADRDIDGMLNIGYEHTGRRYSPLEGISTQSIDEHRLMGSFRLLNARNADLSWGVSGKFLGQLNTFNSQHLLRTAGVPAPKSQIAGDVAPQVHCDGWWGKMQWKVSAGAGIGFASGQASQIFFFPKVKASLLWERQLEVFARAEGGAKAPSLYEIAQDIRFLHPDYIALSESQILDGEVGIRAQLSHGFALTFSGGYTLSRRATYWSPIFFSESYHLPKFIAFRPVPADGSHWFFSGRLGYALGTKFQAFVQWTERRYQLKEGAIAEGKPTQLIDFGATYNATKHLSLSLKTLFRSGIAFVRPIDGLETSRNYCVVQTSAAWRFNDWMAIHGEVFVPGFLFFGREYFIGYRDPGTWRMALGATVLF